MQSRGLVARLGVAFDHAVHQPTRSAAVCSAMMLSRRVTVRGSVRPAEGVAALPGAGEASAPA